MRVAIVDYGVGNLFSVRSACHAVGLNAELTSDCRDVEAADAVIVPGVGAFGDAIATLERLDLVGPIKDVAAKGTPLVGICLGLQLFMTESHEFGVHRGLGLFEGPVIPFKRPTHDGRVLKVPQVGWNRITAPSARDVGGAHPWRDWPLQRIPRDSYMYFVHSYYVQPVDAEVVLTRTRYGDVEFCSSVLRRNVFACQFHPERSGTVGLEVYRNIAEFIARHHSAGEKRSA